MSLENTEYLSQLSLDEIEAVHKKWPNPASVASISPIFIGGIAFLGYNIENSSLFQLIGGIVGILLVTILMLTYTFLKLGKAKKLLKHYSNARSLPPKKVIKEFRRNYSNVVKAIKSSQ